MNSEIKKIMKSMKAYGMLEEAKELEMITRKQVKAGKKKSDIIFEDGEIKITEEEFKDTRRAINEYFKD